MEENTIVLLNDEGMKDTIQAWCKQMWNILVDPTTSEFNKTECPTKLSEGMTLIEVGGSSEVEVGKYKDQYDDALNMTCTPASCTDVVFPCSTHLL